MYVNLTNYSYIYALIFIVLSYHHCHARWTHKCTNTHTLKTHNLLKPLLLQTDDIKVEVRPQAIGPVESDSPGQAIPVGLNRERQRYREDNIREDIQLSASSLQLHFQVCFSSQCSRQSSQRVRTHTLFLFLPLSHTVFVGTVFPGIKMPTQTGCICNSGKAITQSLQIFRGVIGYNVA